MTQIQLRLGAGPAPGELPLEGEPWWDEATGRFGVWSYRNNRVEWLFGSSPSGLSLGADQRLRGTYLNGATPTPNRLALDFSAADTLRIVNTQNGQVVASFGVGATVLTNATVGAEPTGLINHVVNGLQTLISATPQPVQVRADQPLRCVQPNWFAWAGSSSTGELVVTPDTDTITGFGFSRVLRVQADAPSHAGVRTLVHDARRLTGRTVCVSALHRAPVGAKASLRVLAGDVLLQRQALVGTGIYQKVNSSFEVPATIAGPLVIDALYAPEATSGEWVVGPCQLTLGEQPMAWDVRTADVEAALARGLFAERKRYVTSGASQGVDWDLLGPVVRTQLRTLQNTGSVVSLEDVDRLGGLLRATTGTGVNTVVVTAYSYPALTESA